MFLKHFAFLPFGRFVQRSHLELQKNHYSCRFEYAPESEAQLNVQIGKELSASHTYLSIANYYARTTVGLEGCAGFFLNMSNEEREHAFKLMQFQNMRGGHVQLCDIPKPAKEEWTSIKESLEYAIELEKVVSRSLIELKNVAESHQDNVLMEFISSAFLTEPMVSLNVFGRILARLKMVGESGFGEYLIDKELKKLYPCTSKYKIIENLGT